MERRRPAGDQVAVEVRAMAAGAGFSGIVVDGGGAGLLPAVGDEVLGVAPAGVSVGTRLVCAGGEVVRKPAALAHAEAAALAGSGATALRAARLCGARAGDRVLVGGAGDAVGALVVQIGKVRGWRVTAVCPDRDVPLAWDLGADEVHARERAAGVSGPFVAIIDSDQSVPTGLATATLELLGRWLTIRAGAVHVATALGAAVAVQPAARPSRRELVELVELVERGDLFPVRPCGLDEPV